MIPIHPSKLNLFRFHRIVRLVPGVVEMSALDWPIENERLTVFWGPSAGMNRQWADVVGGEPERFENQMNLKLLQESRTLADGTLLVLNTQGRTDLIVQAGTPFGTLGETTLDEFRRIAEKWIRGISDQVVRIAIGRVLLKHVGSGEEGKAALNGLLKSFQLKEGMKEVFFQVNWPTRSSLDPSMELNRATKWAVIEYQNFVLPPSGGVHVPQGKKYCARLEIDLSSALEGPPAGLDRIFDRVEELRSIMKGIQTEGEPQ